MRAKTSKPTEVDPALRPVASDDDALHRPDQDPDPTRAERLARLRAAASIYARAAIRAARAAAIAASPAELPIHEADASADGGISTACPESE